MNNEVKLKPCPFCGGRAYFASWRDYERIYIDCEHKEECGNKISNWLYSCVPIEQQIVNWNTRYEDKKQVKLLGKKTNLWKEE